MTKKKKEPEYIWFDYILILENGRTVEIKIREDAVDKVYEEIKQHLELNGIWWCGNWYGDCFNAKYLGNCLDYIDFKKVIGIG
jgi:predicted nicotinamide N-methyase